ncbi:hypothetical protein TWF128_002185 [Orbilia oligospora]|nr:hypothetical protein TWF128_002185 [Orbilia oligospora]
MSKMGVGKLDFSKVKDTGQAVNLDTAQLTVTIPDNQLNTLKVKALVYFARIATGIKEPFVLIGGYAMELAKLEGANPSGSCHLTKRTRSLAEEKEGQRSTTTKMGIRWSLSQRIKDGKDALWLLGDKLKPNGNLVAVRGLLHSMLFGSAPTEEAFSAEVNFLISTIKKLEVQKGEEGKE